MTRTGALLLALALAACDVPPAEVEHDWAAYQGDAWPGPTPIAWPKAAGVTSDSLSDTLTILDLATLQVTAQRVVGRNPVDVDGPHHLAVDRARGVLYVALSYPPSVVPPGPHAAHGSSQRPGWMQALALDDLRVVGEVPIDPNPGDIVLSADGQTAVASHFDLAAASTSEPLDKRRGALTFVKAAELPKGTVPLRVRTCLLPHGLALSVPDARTVWAACYGEDAVAVVDRSGPKPVVTRVPVGASPGEPGAPHYGPYSAVASPDAGLLAVGCTESKDVRLFQTTTGQMLPLVVPAPGQPFFAAWAPDGKTLWVPTQGPDGLLAVEATTGKVLQTRMFHGNDCKKPHEAAWHGGRVLVTCEGDHVLPGKVLAVDPVGLQTLGQAAVGIYPDRLAIAEAP